MDYIRRTIEDAITDAVGRGRNVLLLGPRQTGKTTLAKRLESNLTLSFVRPDTRQRYEREPSLLIAEVERIAKKCDCVPLIVLDEVQKVPVLLDCAQDLIDRGVARFILLGSSARKLRRGMEINLLPGRVIALRLDPLTWREYPEGTLEDRLLYGSLPSIATLEQPRHREQELRSYVTTYLEEEVRAEAVVRDLAAFGRFLELAAAESGKIVHFRRLSQDVGVAHTTIRSYYQILEDCLIAERVEPWTRSSTRKKITKSPRYLFFDLGIRRSAAREGVEPTHEQRGHLFEQYVGLELLRHARQDPVQTSVHFWRDPDGPEVDWMVRSGSRLTPIEVKWSAAPKPEDGKHIRVFLSEYAEAKRGYVVCRTPRPYDLAQNITALPWQEIGTLFSEGGL